MPETVAIPSAPAVTPSAALPAGRLASSRLETSGPYLVCGAEAYEADELARRPQRATALAGFIGIAAVFVFAVLVFAAIFAGLAALVLATAGMAHVVAAVVALLVGT